GREPHGLPRVAGQDAQVPLLPARLVFLDRHAEARGDGVPTRPLHRAAAHRGVARRGGAGGPAHRGGGVVPPRLPRPDGAGGDGRGRARGSRARAFDPRGDGEGRSVTARVGLVGGSGLYGLPGLTVEEEVRLESPFGAPSDAYVLGTLSGVSVAFLSRHGRGHKLTPSEIN